MLAFNLRAAITSLPPVFPELSATLHLSSASLAALAAVPVLCFGLFSGVAAPLSRRFGEERVLGSSVVLLAAGLLLRGVAPLVLLFPGTIIASASIAMMNVLLPSLVKRRQPEQAGLLIGLYLMSLSAGAIVGSLIAVPVFTAAGGGNAAVRLTLGLWALPAMVAAVAWLPQLRFRVLPDARARGRPGPPPAAGSPPAAGPPPAAGHHGVLALRRHALAWQVTAFMGLQSLLYYATLSWFPTMFRDRGASAVHAGDLLALMNFGNAVTAMLLPVLAHRARDQRVLVAVSTAATCAGLAGLGLCPAGHGARLGPAARPGPGRDARPGHLPDHGAGARSGHRRLPVRVRAGRRLPAGQHRTAVRRPAALGDRRLDDPDRGPARRRGRAGGHRLAGRPRPDRPAAGQPAGPGPGRLASGRPVSSALISHSRRAVVWSRAARDGVRSLRLT